MIQTCLIQLKQAIRLVYSPAEKESNILDCTELTIQLKIDSKYLIHTCLIEVTNKSDSEWSHLHEKIAMLNCMRKRFHQGKKKKSVPI